MLFSTKQNSSHSISFRKRHLDASHDACVNTVPGSVNLLCYSQFYLEEALFQLGCMITNGLTESSYSGLCLSTKLLIGLV